MEIVDQLILEVKNMDIGNFVIIFLLFYVPFHFSKKSQSHFFRLFFSSVGIYLLLTMEDYRVLYDVRMLVGLGLVLPQINFLIFFIKDVFLTIKMMSSNTYYFFITIIYKIIRFFNWIKSIFSNIAILFSSYSSKDSDDFKENNSSNRNYQEENSYEKKQEKKYQNYSSNDNSSSNEKSYKQEYKEEAKQESTFKQKEETQTYNGDERFYNSSAYIVLGVSSNDDFKSIKKAYRTLVRIYHPDLNPDDLKRATEITQLINNAYAKLEKITNS